MFPGSRITYRSKGQGTTYESCFLISVKLVCETIKSECCLYVKRKKMYAVVLVGKD